MVGLLDSFPSPQKPHGENEELFRKNREFYEKHPTSTLELSPLPYYTPYGRKVYKDQFEGIHSESTTTVSSPDGGWMNIPLIYNGRYVSPEDAKRIIILNNMIDPENGEMIRSYPSIPIAEKAARDRMLNLNRPEQPWNR
tara:strand:- start:68 stop:487 length:420 start_codon:yes stop_codon:yes gene_type:complete